MKKTLASSLICAFFCIASAVISYASDARWPGVDETVVEKYAAEHGHTAKPGLIDLEGDALLFAFLMAGVAGGFVTGYYYRDHISAKSRVSEEK